MLTRLIRLRVVPSKISFDIIYVLLNKTDWENILLDFMQRCIVFFNTMHKYLTDKRKELNGIIVNGSGTPWPYIVDTLVSGNQSFIS